MINKFMHSETVWMSAHWAASAFLLTVLVVVAVLVLLMWRWSQKDEKAQVANYYGRARH